MPTVPPSSTSGKARLLSGAGSRPAAAGTHTAAGSGTRTADTSFTATVPFARPPATAPGVTPRAAGAASPAPSALPRWLKGFVIGGVLLALGMPLSVLLSRSMLEQEVMLEESSSKAAMICTGGEARAVDSSSLSGWLFSGSYFRCGDWETREARQQRDRDRDQANYMAREKARQQAQ